MTQHSTMCVSHTAQCMLGYPGWPYWLGWIKSWMLGWIWAARKKLMVNQAFESPKGVLLIEAKASWV